MSHTPGPWKIHWPDEFNLTSPAHAVAMIEFGPGDWGSFWIVDHRGIVRDTDPMQPADAKADVKLIAAAPDLLAACQAMVAAHNLNESYSASEAQNTRMLACEAIKKATA